VVPISTVTGTLTLEIEITADHTKNVLLWPWSSNIDKIDVTTIITNVVIPRRKSWIMKKSITRDIMIPCKDKEVEAHQAASILGQG
jgi:hypothetical protein